MSKLDINTEDFSTSFLAQEPAEEMSQPQKKEKTGGMALTECIRISSENKYALKKYLLKKEKETGKFIALNRHIDNILSEWIEQHKD
ncbi:MAG: hypothetical protein IJ383_00015 [Bacteroidales bacterium]|nr:hypothetical protein [Bacteroidales bacterium]